MNKFLPKIFYSIMVVNQLVFTHRALRKHKLSHFPIRYYIVIDVLSLMRQNWLLYSTIVDFVFSARIQ